MQRHFDWHYNICHWTISCIYFYHNNRNFRDEFLRPDRCLFAKWFFQSVKYPPPPTQDIWSLSALKTRLCIIEVKWPLRGKWVQKVNVWYHWDLGLWWNRFESRYKAALTSCVQLALGKTWHQRTYICSCMPQDTWAGLSQRWDGLTFWSSFL